ncbi:NUDIX domain-containing protein [Sphingobacterium sp. ML3W]|uniref:NUDIX domain-containing protein n=1 Tax=Sphingobacterium sp. ML3W TaxID=1538644 RepID=UPI00384D654E
MLSTRSKSKDKLYFPGGKREHGKTDLACLKREILEELNVYIVKDSVRFLVFLKQWLMDVKRTERIQIIISFYY